MKMKKILVIATTVIVFAAIGLTANSFIRAISNNSNNSADKYNKLALSGNTSNETEIENDADSDAAEYDETANVDAETSATPKKTQTSQGTQEITGVDTTTSATPKGTLTATGIPTQIAGGVDIVTSATPKSTQTTTDIQGVPVTPGIDVVSSATKQPISSTAADLSSEAVKQIVLSKAPGAIISELELDEDDGILVYEVKAYVGQDEYEFVIDANSGTILVYKPENDEDDDSYSEVDNSDDYDDDNDSDDGDDGYDDDDDDDEEDDD